MSQPSRKRSRWGGDPPAVPSSGPSVSDQDALQALLASARQEEQRKKPARREDYKRRPPKASSHHHTKSSDRSARSGNDYYGPASSKDDKASDKEGEEAAVEKQKPDFGLSGALVSKDMKTGGTYKGVVLKFSEPPEARAPNTLWRFYVFKGEEQLDTLHISQQSAYLFGRNEEIADITLHHPSCSSQHAVLQYRALPNKETGKLQCKPYLMDPESTNGSFINGVRIDSARYYQLKGGDVLKFGASTREYVLLSAKTKSVS